MAVQTRISPVLENLDLQRAGLGLIYDADSVTLIGKFSDELSAHRAKKRWTEVLRSHFLLDSERDFELVVSSSHESSLYAVVCTFVSACGRYAFWRLINRQAPEAEQKLRGHNGGKSMQQASPEPTRLSWSQEAGQTTFVLSSLDEQIEQAQINKGLMNRLLDLFRS